MFFDLINSDKLRSTLCGQFLKILLTIYYGIDKYIKKNVDLDEAQSHICPTLITKWWSEKIRIFCNNYLYSLSPLCLYTEIKLFKFKNMYNIDLPLKGRPIPKKKDFNSIQVILIFLI